MQKNNNMNGKICMITGSNSGIGKATAIGLAEMGATIIMVCRNTDRGEKAKKEIIDKTSNTSIDLLLADLSSQQAIRNLVDNYQSKYEKLHVLINNAAIMPYKKTFTEDNNEMQFAVNVLAPFLLTNLLIDILKKSAPSRILNVTSGLHTRAHIDFNNLQSEKKYSAFGTYGRVKLALVIFNNELARRLENSGITVNSLHPGTIRSSLGRDLPWYYRWAIVFFRNPKKGAETPVYLASSPEVEGISGKYFKNKKEAKPSKEANNKEYGQKLWDICSELTNLNS
ncbi:MAG: SDR family oxidoreductase [Candidatus Helarchaeota archaeon]|nr:SDR family oxidoreductase [Candidatus Helarchaeota archaeon]